MRTASYTIRSLSAKNIRFDKVGLLVIVILIMRMFFIVELPLMDKTEARYAEVSRIIAEKGNWVMPEIDYGVPFWAKPPLSSWLSAISIRLFGANEFAVRLPSFLLCTLLAVLLGRYSKRKGMSFFLPFLVLLTIPEFLIHVGVVSTDVSLTFCITLAMVSFWESMYQSYNGIWKYLFFVALGLGMLAKGPIILILTIPPIAFWMFLTHSWFRFFLVFSFRKGILLFFLIWVPWYIIAEIESPGFIDYFIGGEHFKRFFDSTWKGDKYGFPKQQPLGIIWLFLFIFTLPWLQLFIWRIRKNLRNVVRNNWNLFLISWLLWTPLFFSASSSLIHTYILPSTVPLSLLIVNHWKFIRKPFRVVYFVVGILMILTGGLLYLQLTEQDEFYFKTDKYLVQNVKNESPLFYYGNKSYSCQFYSKGKTEEVKSMRHRDTSKSRSYYLIINNSDGAALSRNLEKEMELIDNNRYKSIFRITQNSD